MNTTFTLKPVAIPATTANPYHAVIRLVRFVLRQLTRCDDPAARHYGASKYNGKID
jgi:hypothetical protein